MIDIRAEVDDLLNTMGYYVLLQRSSNLFKCKCTYEGKEDLFSNSVHKCRLCNGTGKVIKLEKVKGIFIEQQVQPYTIKDIGYVADRKFQFYFSHDIDILDGDVIYEVGWLKDMPYTLHNIYKIKSVETPRCDNGRIEYKVANSYIKNNNRKQIEQDFIRNITTYNNKYISNGGDMVELL